MASNGVDGESSADRNVEIWKIKKLIKSLEAARGNGTSMISLIIPPRDQIARVNKMLADEFGTASNIKSRVNRLSVLGAITSVQQRLKLYNKVPPNGLVIYCGTIITEEGKEKKVNIDFEPFRPINTSLYLCDNKFHTEALTALLADDNKFGFIVMDGNGALFGTLSGNTREVLHKFTVDLPKKHGRGGQSALRFARLRMEKRHNYVRKVAEVAVQLFISNDKPNISGRYFDEISQNTGKYVYGVVDTLTAMEMGAVDILIVWENLDIQRFVLKNHSNDEEKILHLTPDQEKDKTYFTDKEVNCATLEIITDRSQEGAQFVKGFGGIGGILRYQVDFQALDPTYDGLLDDFDLDDY
ncbi:eukaryotic peptide chain release factor subunit 1 [Elysia marginata]|uniref:Eukaryotic peptide chain release factor subunit 1 n=1 Tax=Elysia marginata TaxID=1093978 RepID=A0AAV4HN03_9GAST|nr:eukaryotic peptide chain release factor subunit 1 [Elysia marginata]